MKYIYTLVALVCIGAGAYYAISVLPGQSASEPAASENYGMNPAESSAMRAEPNAVMVFEQLPGKTITGTVFLEAPGYLVIHEDANGEFGAIIGSSTLLQAGENAVEIHVSRDMRDGESLYAMLHFEKGGNTSFSAAEDTPVLSMLGGPIYGIFDVTADASSNPPISI